jgi:hypothetical protein
LKAELANRHKHPSGCWRFFGADLKDCGKVFGVLAEPALFLLCYMLGFKEKQPAEKIGSDRIN